MGSTGLVVSLDSSRMSDSRSAVELAITEGRREQKKNNESAISQRILRFFQTIRCERRRLLQNE